MASNLDLKANITGGGTLTGSAGLTTPISQFTIGQGLWPAMSLALGFGTANFQAKTWWQQSRTILAGANDDLDLSGVLNNELGDNAIAFLAIKLMLLAIDAPDGVKKLKVGPGAAGAAVANAFIGPWANVASSFVTIDNFGIPINNPWGGYPVVAGTADQLRITNPGAASVTYRILLAGTT
jgi:hypothetical protein